MTNCDHFYDIYLTLARLGSAAAVFFQTEQSLNSDQIWTNF